MKHSKTNQLQLKVKTILTFESKTGKREKALTFSDPTSVTLPTTSDFPFDFPGRLDKKD